MASQQGRVGTPAMKNVQSPQEEYVNVNPAYFKHTFKEPTDLEIKVDSNSPASGQIHNGDAIIAIGGTNAQNLTHMQAHQLIKSAGTHLSLTVLKGHFGDLTGLKPKGPVKFSPWRHS